MEQRGGVLAEAGVKDVCACLGVWVGVWVQVGLGRVLVVERMRFEDLDELIVGYLDPLVNNEKK